MARKATNAIKTNQIKSNRNNKNESESWYITKTGKNGLKYIPWSQEAVKKDVLHLSTGGNEKTGKVAAFNLPVELTCDHSCECYSEKICYACGGCYLYGDNQLRYSENLRFFLEHSDNDFVNEIVKQLVESKRNLFRWFTCGDIVNYRFLECMVKVARIVPDVRFWTYTKKYKLVNKWIKRNGSLPVNLVIVFSHWKNKDGSYFPMDNPYNLPTSEYIPYGEEHLLSTVNHVCPCSDPDIFVQCANCPNPCYELKPGQSMALCEHSTPATKQRDKWLKEMKEAAKKAGNWKLKEALEKCAKLANKEVA